MKKILFITCMLFAFNIGCAKKNLIVHGSIHHDTYKSDMAGFKIGAPPNWNATIIPPNNIIESKINKKIIRERELGYFVKEGQTAFIVIETYPLTWARKKRLPTDFTRTKGGSEVLNDACEYFLGKQRGLFYNNKPVDYSFKCNKIPYGYWCSTKDPCLESEMKITPNSISNPIVIERVYLTGPELKEVLKTPIDLTLHGWRVCFSLETPQSDYDDNLKVFNSVISGMIDLYPQPQKLK